MQTAQIIPFKFEACEVRTLLIDGQPWFVAADVCRVLDVTNTSQALQALDEDERSMFNIGRQGQANIINESGMYTLILRCRDAVKKGSKPHAFRKWLTAEVLPAIRKHGRYEDSRNNLGTLIGETIGTNGFNMLGALVKGKVAQLPTATQRRATAKIWSQTHAAFGVRSAADIPADQLDAARNFIAAYALEGEYLPKQDGIQLEPGPLRRYLVSFNHEGKQQVSAIPSDACVLSHRDLIKGMITPGEIMVSTEEMFEFAMSALTNLKGRSDYQAKQLHHLKSTR